LLRARGGDQRVGDPKEIQMLLTVMLATTAGNQGTSKKNCMKYKEMLKKKGCTDSDGASTSEKSEKVSVVEEADENPCDVLITHSGRGKYLDVWLLDSRCTYYMCPKRE